MKITVLSSRTVVPLYSFPNQHFESSVSVGIILRLWRGGRSEEGIKLISFAVISEEKINCVYLYVYVKFGGMLVTVQGCCL